MCVDDRFHSHRLRLLALASRLSESRLHAVEELSHSGGSEGFAAVGVGGRWGGGWRWLHVREECAFQVGAKFESVKGEKGCEAV